MHTHTYTHTGEGEVKTANDLGGGGHGGQVSVGVCVRYSLGQEARLREVRVASGEARHTSTRFRAHLSRPLYHHPPLSLSHSHTHTHVQCLSARPQDKHAHNHPISCRQNPSPTLLTLDPTMSLCSSCAAALEADFFFFPKACATPREARPEGKKKIAEETQVLLKSCVKGGEIKKSRAFCLTAEMREACSGK